MIRVLHVVSDTNIGGAGKVVVNLIKAAPAGEAVIKAVIPRGGALKDELLENGAEVIEAGGIADKSLSLGGIISLLGVIRRERPDIVHAHAGLSARIAARMLGVKTVFTRHWRGETGVSRISGRVNDFLCDAAFAVSRAAYASLLATGIREDKIILLYNGVEALKRDEGKSLLKELGIARKTVVGIAARLEPVKNHYCLLDAAAKILREREDLVFLIAGAGSLEAELKAHAKRLGIGGSVRFLGFVRDMDAFMSAVDINVLCSMEEAFPTSVIEAMSVGTPTVATSCGGTEEQIEQGVNGVLVGLNDADALAAGILALADDPAYRERLGGAALETYRERFGADRFAKGTLEAYRKILRGGRANEADK